jgi:hypothetical protein
MKYKIIYSISDSAKRKTIENYLASAGFEPQLPFSSMTATLEVQPSELKRNLKKLKCACMLSKTDTFTLISEAGNRQEEFCV